MMEMISRIKAVLRRTTPKEDAPVLMCGGITLNTVKHQVSVHDQPVTLTLKEYELLRTFMENLARHSPGSSFFPRSGALTSSGKPGRWMSISELCGPSWEAAADDCHRPRSGLQNGGYR